MGRTGTVARQRASKERGWRMASVDNTRVEGETRAAGATASSRGAEHTADPRPDTSDNTGLNQRLTALEQELTAIGSLADRIVRSHNQLARIVEDLRASLGGRHGANSVGRIRQ